MFSACPGAIEATGQSALWLNLMPITKRSDIRPGMRVQVVEKQNQRTGALTEGIVARLLTKSPNHPRGIKVMLEDGTVGRVQAILDAKTE